MFLFKHQFNISPAMAKLIRESTNKSLERKLNVKKDLFDCVKKENTIDNIELNTNSVISKTNVLCTFFCLISFLAGYHYKSLQM
jgi:hypothetical protein